MSDERLRWSKSENETIARMFREGRKDREIAEVLTWRAPLSIGMQRRKLGYRRNRYPGAPLKPKRTTITGVKTLGDVLRTPLIDEEDVPEMDTTEEMLSVLQVLQKDLKDIRDALCQGGCHVVTLSKVKNG